jgi:hypothetical protein
LAHLVGIAAFFLFFFVCSAKNEPMSGSDVMILKNIFAKNGEKVVVFCSNYS